MKRIIPIALAFVLTGCNGASGLGELLDEAQGSNVVKSIVDGAGKADDAVVGNFAKLVGGKYCPNVPGVVRRTARNHVNARPEMKGAQIAIWCPGDSPLTLGTP